MSGANVAHRQYGFTYFANFNPEFIGCSPLHDYAG